MTVATGYTLRVPDSWWEFDVWRATRTGDLARLVDSRIAADRALAPHRGVLLKLLRDAAAHAERHGARFCAVSADPVDGAGTLLAIAMVFETAAPPGLTGVEAIAGRITARAPAPGSPSWRRVEIVDVPAGRAVRVSGVERTDMGGGRCLDTVTMQTLVPVPDGDEVLNVVLTSPQVPLAEPMLDLFEAVSDTLSFVSSH
jgi:hypothetical protein